MRRGIRYPAALGDGEIRLFIVDDEVSVEGQYCLGDIAIRLTLLEGKFVQVYIVYRLLLGVEESSIG